jgi:hypothetical protein
MNFDIHTAPQQFVKTPRIYVNCLRQLKLLSAIKSPSVLVDLACSLPACSAPNDVLEPLNGR